MICYVGNSYLSCSRGVAVALSDESDTYSSVDAARTQCSNKTPTVPGGTWTIGSGELVRYLYDNSDNSHVRWNTFKSHLADNQAQFVASEHNDFHPYWFDGNIYMFMNSGLTGTDIIPCRVRAFLAF